MGLYDVWLDFRDRCLTSPKFHAFALKFPPTRPIVRKRQQEVFDVVSGFIYSQVLLACVELDVLDPEKLKSPGVTLDEFAELTDLKFDQARRLAKAAAALRLLEERNGRFRLGDLGAALSINEGALAMIRHHPALYRDLTDIVPFLKSGRGETYLSRYWDYARNAKPHDARREDVEPYSKLMSASQQAVSEEVIASFNFLPFRSLLDLGGGQGTFLANVANAAPNLDLHLFDLPQVAELARVSWEKRGIASSLKTHGGSFFDNDLPRGVDLISLIRILHDHDDGPVMQILGKAYEALEPGGTLLIAEPMSSGGAATRISDAYFNMYLYAMGSGRPRSPDELFAMIKKAGFSSCKTIPTRTSFTTSIIVAEK